MNGHTCRSHLLILLLAGILALSLADPLLAAPPTVHTLTLSWSVDVPAREEQATFWGALQPLTYPGLPRLEALPLLLPMPQGTVRLVTAKATPSQCTTLLDTPSRNDHPFVRNSDGASLSLILPPELRPTSGLWPAALFRADPLTWQGSQPLLPLLLYPERTNLDSGVSVRCARFDIDVEIQQSPSLPFPVASPENQPREQHPLLILTREDFVLNSEQLAAYLQAKTEEGLNPMVITEEEIEKALPDPLLNRPKRIRTWLQQNYQAMGFKYLLIIGNPSADQVMSIPMQTCFPAKGYDTTQDDVPTDMYYADLTGEWDWNQNGLPCEFEDYMDPVTWKKVGGVDLTPELLVGRIPHQGATPYYTDEILKRTLAYQHWSGKPWTNRVLLPSPLVTFPDGSFVDITQVARYVADKSLVPHGVAYKVLGEADGMLPGSAPFDQPLTPESMATSWEDGYGVVFWCAHGNEQGAYRDIWWTDDNADGLPQQMEVEEPAFVNAEDFVQFVTQEHPPIVFQASCLNAMPEDGNNLAHRLLRRASIANIASVRITMGLATGGEWEPSPFTPGAFTMGFYFVNAMMTQPDTVGEAFASARSAVSLGAEPWTYKMRLEFNLYGDPTTRRPICTSDAECDDGSVCTGTEHCADGQCQAGQPMACPGAAGPCRQARCDPVQGCIEEQSPDGTSCNDGAPCTISDSCEAGLCAGVPKACPNSNPCVETYCEPQSGACSVKLLPEESPCDGKDGAGTCSSGYCWPTAETVEAEEIIEEVATDMDQTDETDIHQATNSGSGCATQPHQSANVASSMSLLLMALLVLWAGKGRAAPWQSNRSRR